MTFLSFWRAVTLGATILALATVTTQAASLASGEMSESGNSWATVEVTQATRKDGILTVAIRLKAGDDVTGFNRLYFYRGHADGYGKVYLVAGKKKYFVLKDSEGTPLMPEDGMIKMDKGKGRAVWSARFPAPPAEMKDFSLVLPLTSPLDSIAITDQ